MPSGLGKLQRKNQQDFFFQGATATAPTNIFVAWHTGDPLDDGSAANEVGNSNNYSRTTFAAGTTNWNAATTPSNDAASIVTNKLAIVTATASGSWGTITFFSLRATSTIGDTTAGNMYGRGAVSPGQVVGAGQFITIPAGSASFSNNSS
jgi:hypothetical protein